jgi:hypothetical protein
MFFTFFACTKKVTKKVPAAAIAPHAQQRQRTTGSHYKLEEALCF